MKSLDDIKLLIQNGEIENALTALNEFIELTDSSQLKSEAYYLRGNAYRKQANWQQALNNYHLAIESDPDSPAVEALKMLNDILSFYNKDMFNQ